LRRELMRDTEYPLRVGGELDRRHAHLFTGMQMSREEGTPFCRTGARRCAVAQNPGEHRGSNSFPFSSCRILGPT
jgi:hypothetical protein